MPTADQPVSREEARRRHKKKARRRMLRRLLILVILIAVGAVLWRNWDALAPDKLMMRLRDSMNDSAGTFPVDIAGTNVSTLVRVQGDVAALGDTYLTFYNDDGGEVSRFSCTYAEPVVRTAGKYLLIAEQGGRHIQLFTRSAVVQDISCEQEILSAAVNAKGQFAVLLQGAQGYAVQISVYDRKGKVIYTRSRHQMATDIALSGNGEKLALLSPQTAEGYLNTVIESFLLSSADTQAQFSYAAQDTLLYRLAYLDGDRLAAVGENGVLVFHGTGEPLSYPLQSERVLGYAAGSDRLALALRDYGDTAGGRVVLIDGNARECGTADFSGDFRYLAAEKQRFLLLTDSAVQTVNESGGGKEIPVAADGQQAALCGHTAIVLGLNTICSYSLNG